MYWADYLRAALNSVALCQIICIFTGCQHDGLLSCVLQGAEIISQSSRIEAEDEASSDGDKSLPEDSASDSDEVSDTHTHTYTHTVSVTLCSLLHILLLTQVGSMYS